MKAPGGRRPAGSSRAVASQVATRAPRVEAEGAVSRVSRRVSSEGDSAELVRLAKLTLRSVCVSDKAPAAARAQAARTLLEVAGALKTQSQKTPSQGEMSEAELDAIIRKSGVFPTG